MRSINDWRSKKKDNPDLLPFIAQFAVRVAAAAALQ